MAARQTRAIAKLPAHLTHVPNVQIRALLGAPDVVQQLHDAGGRHLAHLTDIQSTTPQDIRCHAIALTQLRHVLTTYKLDTDAVGQSPSVPAEETYSIKCDLRGLGLTTFNSMRKHKTRVHGVNDRQQITFDPAEHAVNGLPQCRFCSHKFDTWHALKSHIAEDRRTQTPWMQARLQAMSGAPEQDPHTIQTQVEDGLVSTETPTRERPTQTYPILKNQAVKNMVQQRGWRSLITSEHQQHLRQHCVVCARWIVDPSALKRHLQKAHKDVWSKVTQKLEGQCTEVKGDLIRDGVCPCCDRTSYSRHYRQCNVIFQSAIAGLFLCSQDDGSGDANADVPAPATGTCVADLENSHADAAAPTRARSAQAPSHQEGSTPSSGQQGQHAANNFTPDGAGASTRRRTQSSQTKHKPDVLSTTTRTGLSPAAAVQGESRVAHKQNRRSGRRVSPHHHSECVDSGNHGKAHHARKQPSCPSGSQASGHPERRQQDAISEMECSEQKIRDRHSTPA